MKQFEIFFHDLTPEAQKNLLEQFETTEEDENWDTFPITVIEREDGKDLYEWDSEYYCFCPDEKALEQYAFDGCWAGIEDLENETGVSRDELIGVWFLISHSRVYLK